MTPRLSVVTPSLNQVDYLRQCVASVRALGPGVQHVVGDGASHDGTLAFLREQGIAHRSQRDGGMYEAVNAAVALTDGEILGYLNCDDLYLPWTATCVLETFARHPDVDLVVGDALELRGTRLAFTVHPPTRGLIPFLHVGGYLAQPAVFFRRALWERLHGFDTSFHLLADHDFWLRALKTGARVARVWEVLAVQRMVDGQLMQRQADKAREEHARIERRHGFRTRRVHALASAALHRLAMVAVGMDCLVPVRVPAPWSRARYSGLLSVPSVDSLWRALTHPSAQVVYLTPGRNADDLLFPRM